MPDSVALWKTTCGSNGLPVVSAMEITAGLRRPSGRDRIRDRSARPRDHAVAAVKEGKMVAGEDSSAAIWAGCMGSDQLGMKQLNKIQYYA